MTPRTPARHAALVLAATLIFAYATPLAASAAVSTEASPRLLAIDAEVTDHKLHRLTVPDGWNCSISQYVVQDRDTKVAIHHTRLECVPTVQLPDFCIYTSVSAGGSGGVGHGGAISACTPEPAASCAWATGVLNPCSAWNVGVGSPFPWVCHGWGTTPSYGWGCGMIAI